MNAEIVAPIVNFAVVAFVLWYIGRKPTAQFFAERSKRIAGQIAEGEKLNAEAEKVLGEWESNWKASEAHAKSALDDAKVTVTRFRETTLNAAGAESERIRQDARLVGQSEALRAKSNIGRELAEKSVQMAAQYLRSHLEDNDRHRLVNEYVEKLGNGKA